MSAIEYWVASVRGNIHSAYALQLLPVLDRNANIKLERASGVGKVTVRLPRGLDATGMADAGEVGAAIAEVSAVTLGEMEVEVTLSLGRGRRPSSRPMHDRVLRGLRHFVGGEVRPLKAKASLWLDDEDGGQHSEKVDFIKQKVAYPARFEVNQDEHLSEEQALRGMAEAIGRLREDVL
jgi:hypothetical protein